jgi:hypothetical protein
MQAKFTLFSLEFSTYYQYIYREMASRLIYVHISCKTDHRINANEGFRHEK